MAKLKKKSAKAKARDAKKRSKVKVSAVICKLQKEDRFPIGEAVPVKPQNPLRKKRSERTPEEAPPFLAPPLHPISNGNTSKKLKNNAAVQKSYSRKPKKGQVDKRMVITAGANTRKIRAQKPTEKVHMPHSEFKRMKLEATSTQESHLKAA